MSPQREVDPMAPSPMEPSSEDKGPEDKGPEDKGLEEARAEDKSPMEASLEGQHPEAQSSGAQTSEAQNSEVQNSEVQVLAGQESSGGAQTKPQSNGRQVAQVEAGQAEFDSWAMARFDDDAPDGVRMVRINTAMIARRGKHKFAVRLGLAVPGCPWVKNDAKEASEELDTAEGLELEGAIHAFLQREAAGVLPVVVCEADTREYIIYLTSTEQGEALVERMAQDHPDLDFHYYMARDREWEAYWGLADSLGLLEPGADLGQAQAASC